MTYDILKPVSPPFLGDFKFKCQPLINIPSRELTNPWQKENNRLKSAKRDGICDRSLEGIPPSFSVSHFASVEKRYEQRKKKPGCLGYIGDPSTTQ